MMPAMFAEAASTSATAFTDRQLGAALGILLFALTVVIAWRKVFGHEPPLHKEYVTRIEVEKIERSLKDDLTKQAGSRKQMHKEIEDLRVAQGRLEEKTDSQTQQLFQLDNKIEDLPDKILRIIEHRTK
jgi:hypothetical protein